MINLDTTTRSLEVVLAGAKTTVDCPFVSSFSETSAFGAVGGGPPIPQRIQTNGTTNGVTAVTIMPAPGIGTVTRQLNSLSVFNLDTGQVTVTIQTNDNGTRKVITTEALQVGETLCYEDQDGFYCMDVNGARKSQAGATSSASSTADSKAVQASSQASSVSSSAQTGISQASSQAVSAGTGASAASSQAVSAGTAASTASSAASSANTGASTASSQALSAGTAASTASSAASSANVGASTASSQALSAGTAASTASSAASSANTTANAASSNQSLGSSAGWSVSISKTKSSFGF